jgi:hypothetical protein
MPPVDAATLSDAEQAVAYLEEVSPQLRGCAILDGEGEVLAASGDPERWGPAAQDLLNSADAAGGEPVTHAHVAAAEGEAFCVREGRFAAVAVTERFVLASLMIFDLRTVLRELARAG